MGTGGLVLGAGFSRRAWARVTLPLRRIPLFRRILGILCALPRRIAFRLGTALAFHVAAALLHLRRALAVLRSRLSVVRRVEARTLELDCGRREKLLQRATTVGADRRRRIGKTLDDLRSPVARGALVFVKSHWVSPRCRRRPRERRRNGFSTGSSGSRSWGLRGASRDAAPRKHRPASHSSRRRPGRR